MYVLYEPTLRNSAHDVPAGNASAGEKVYVSNRYAELPPMVTDALVVPARDVVLVGAPLAVAAIILTVDDSLVNFLTHSLTEVTLNVPLEAGSVVKTKPKP